MALPAIEVLDVADDENHSGTDSKHAGDGTDTNSVNSVESAVGSKRNSLVWSFFQVLPNDNTKAQCKCGHILKNGTGNDPLFYNTKNLMRHIKALHENEISDPSLRGGVKHNRKDPLQRPLADESRKSAIWQFFELSPDDKNNIRCKICQNTYVRGPMTSHSNLVKHLQTKHKASYEAAIKRSFEGVAVNDDPYASIVLGQPFSPDIFSLNFTFNVSRLILGRLKTLTVSFNQYKLQVPLFLVDAFNLICYRVKTEGLFQVRGSVDRIKFMRYTFFGEFGLPEYCTLYDICGLVEYFLSHLPEPLLSEKIENDFLEFCQTNEASISKPESIPGFKDILESMPTSNRDVLVYLAVKWKTVAAFQTFNLASPTVIGNFFLPSIFRSSKTHSHQAKIQTILMFINQINSMLAQKKALAAISWQATPTAPQNKTPLKRPRVASLRPLFPKIVVAPSLASLDCSFSTQSVVPVAQPQTLIAAKPPNDVPATDASADQSTDSAPNDDLPQAPALENLKENEEKMQKLDSLEKVNDVEKAVGKLSIDSQRDGATIAAADVDMLDEGIPDSNGSDSTTKLELANVDSLAKNAQDNALQCKDVVSVHFCTHCSKKFNSANLLNLHRRAKHADFYKTTLYCKLCSFKTESPSAMQTHQRAERRKNFLRPSLAELKCKNQSIISTSKLSSFKNARLKRSILNTTVQCPVDAPKNCAAGLLASTANQSAADEGVAGSPMEPMAPLEVSTVDADKLSPTTSEQANASDDARGASQRLH